MKRALRFLVLLSVALVATPGMSMRALTPVQAAELPPLEHISGSFLDLEASTLDSSLAVDPAGGEHMAIERWAPGYGGVPARDERDSTPRCRPLREIHSAVSYFTGR